MGFFDFINPVSWVEKAVTAVKAVVTKIFKAVVDAVTKIIETAASVLSKLGEWFAKGVTEFVRVGLQALEWVMDVVAKVFGLGKDGFLTNFFQDNIPFAGLLSAAIHGIRGNKHHAEYAAVKGFATGVEGLAAAAGALGGPAGAMLGAAIGAAARHGVEAGLRGELDPSVRGKIAPFSLEGMLTDMAIGAALGGAGSASKLGKVAAKRKGLLNLAKGAEKIGAGSVAKSLRKKAAREAINITAIKAAQKAGKRGATAVSKDIAKKIGREAGTSLTIKNLGKKVLVRLPKNIAEGAGRSATGQSKRGNDSSWVPKLKTVPWAVAVLVLIVGPALTILVLIFNPTGGVTLVEFALPPRFVVAGEPATDQDGQPPRDTTSGAPVTGGEGDSGGGGSQTTTPSGTGDPTTQPVDPDPTATTPVTNPTTAPTATPTPVTDPTTAPSPTATPVTDPTPTPMPVPNRAPVANDLSLSQEEMSGTNHFLLRFCCSDPDGDELTIISVTQPEGRGFVEIRNNGTAVQVSTGGGGAGTFTFTYTVSDPAGLTDTATVTVNVSARS
jgi:hypothetical protein